MNPAGQKSGYTTVWAAPEILNGAGTITQETDVFAFGMVVIEIVRRALPHLVSEAGVRLTSEYYLRFLREGVHWANSQPRPLLWGLSIANGQLVRGRRKN